MRNPTYEQVLNKFKVAYEYVADVPIGEINHTRGRQIQGRLEPIDLALVEEYRKMFEEGFQSPPLLFWKPSKGAKYVPLDGNQRMAAILTMPKGKQPKSVSAYVVSTEDQMVVDRLAWQFNNMVNGRRLSYEECVAHAMTFVRKYGQAVSATAKDWGIKAWELQQKVTEANMRDLAMAHKIDVKHVPAAQMYQLARLEKLGEDVVLKAIETVATAGVGVESVIGLASDISKAKTSADKMRVIDEFAKSEKVAAEKAASKGGKVRMAKQPPRILLQRQLGHMHSLFAGFAVEALKPVGKEEAEHCRTLALNVANRLISLYGLGRLLNGDA